MRFAALATLALLSFPAAALAHGRTATTDPRQGARLDAVPGQVSVKLTEPPAPRSQLEVRDGCGRQVAEAVRISGDRLSAIVAAGARPGRWRASYRAVSAVDGHLTRDSWSFRVAGRPRCDAAGGGRTGVSDDPSGNARDADAAAPRVDDEPVGGSFPVVPVVLGAAGLLALAAVVRAVSTR